MVRAAARFHHHPHGLQLSEVIAELGSSELLAPDLARLDLNPVQLHHVLCNVKAVRRTIHFGASVSSGCSTQLHFGTRCRSTARPHLPSSRAVFAAFAVSQRIRQRVGGVHTISSVSRWWGSSPCSS